MADVADVEKALVGQIAGTLFPGTSYSAGAVRASTPAGASCRLYRGWPVANELDADLAAGVANVSVFPPGAMSRNTTRFMPQWQQLSTVASTLTVSVSGATATFAGTCAVGQIAGLIVGGVTYPYVVQATDTAATVAAALAALVPGASASGAAVTVPSATHFVARVVMEQQAWVETRRQMQTFRVTCWCPSPVVRDTVAALVDNAIAGMTDSSGNLTRWLPLADGTAALLLYARSETNDAPQKDALWRRDLLYTAEYPTTLIQQQPEMLFGLLNLNSVTYPDNTP